MMSQDLPTLDGEKPGVEPEVGLLATHYGGQVPLSERFRRAQLRAQMFGDPGETLTVGRYRLTGQVGVGAMGTVYRAVDPSLDREVAVKVLHRSDDMHRARMTIEAKALAKLSHPNVVTVHEVGTENGQLFVAMEFVQGKTLSAWLQDPTGPRLLEVFVQAAEGLQAAHDAGIVHRDFKPDNMIVGDDGRVRVLDFGMARSPGAPLLQEVEGEASEQQALEPAITRTGLLAGTPGYMAPEQFEGSRVDARADQFAFCIALHEAVWGRRPFAGETVADLATVVLGGGAQLFEGEPRTDMLSHEIEAARAVIERGLQTDPGARFESMRELAGRLRGVPAKRNGFTPPTSTPRRIVLGVVSFMAAGFLMNAATNEFRDSPSPVSAEPAPARDVEAVVAQTPKPATKTVAEEKRCGLGTELRNGACLPIEWDPSTVHCTDGSCTVDRGLMVGDEPLFLRQARFVPARSEQGTPLGFKVFGVRKDTALGLVGFQNGDIVRTLNDIKLESDLDEILPQLEDVAQTAETLTIVFERDGHVEETVVHVQDQAPKGPSVLGLTGCEDGICSIPRDYFEASSTEEAPVARGIRIVPASDADGHWLGLKLFGVDDDTIAYALGLRTGDVLTQVEDIALTSTEALLPFERLVFIDKVDTLHVSYERAGEPRQFTVELRD